MSIEHIFVIYSSQHPFIDHKIVDDYTYSLNYRAVFHKPQHFIFNDVDHLISTTWSPRIYDIMVSTTYYCIELYWCHITAIWKSFHFLVFLTSGVGRRSGRTICWAHQCNNEPWSGLIERVRVLFCLHPIIYPLIWTFVNIFSKVCHFEPRAPKNLGFVHSDFNMGRYTQNVVRKRLDLI